MLFTFKTTKRFTQRLPPIINYNIILITITKIYNRAPWAAGKGVRKSTDFAKGML